MISEKDLNKAVKIAESDIRLSPTSKRLYQYYVFLIKTNRKNLKENGYDVTDSFDYTWVTNDKAKRHLHVRTNRCVQYSNKQLIDCGYIKSKVDRNTGNNNFTTTRYIYTFQSIEELNNVDEERKTAIINRNHKLDITRKRRSETLITHSNNQDSNPSI